MIGPFTFSGTLSEAGQVVMFKQYIGRHGVDYVGATMARGPCGATGESASPTGAG
jgi:hypothetical protein